MTHIDESLTAKGFTPAASVPQVFGRARTIDGVVIHHWGSLGQTHDGVVNFFVNGPGATSAHFVVSDGRIHCLVNPADAAWHSGNAVGNATTIGIECRPEATDGDYETVAELVSYLRSQYGPLPLSPHQQWQSTACPGVWDLARIDSLAGIKGAAIAPQGTITQVTPAPEATPTVEGEGKMIVLATDGKSPQVWIGDGIIRRPVWSLDTMSALQWLDANKVLGPFFKGGEVQTIPDLNSVGIDILAVLGKDVNGR